MNDTLSQREAFHLHFLRWLVRHVPPSACVLKGGVNLRFFFESIRYSEDMDLDVTAVPREKILEKVMMILGHREFHSALDPYGIDEVVPPDLKVAKQTDTVQRFKVHLITKSGIDLFTKIEFSRRGVGKGATVESLPMAVARRHRITPFVIAHYNGEAAVLQKVGALAGRAAPQARDVFDLYMLLRHVSPEVCAQATKTIRADAVERALSFDFKAFKGGVVEYLSDDDSNEYGTKEMWETIQLEVVHALEAGRGSH